MDADNARRAALSSLQAWGRSRRKLETDRDPLVRAALKAGVTIEEIHKATDLGRSTIDRIKKEAGDA